MGSGARARHAHVVAAAHALTRATEELARALWVTIRVLCTDGALAVLARCDGTARTTTPSTRSCASSRRCSRAVALVALAFAALTSFKGSKDMRIWLPVLPAYAAYMGVGLLALAGKPTAPAARLRAAVVATLMLAGVLHAALHASRTPTAPFGAFERAARWLEEAPVPVEGRAPRVASSYHWAVLFRTPADWELEKLPFQSEWLF